MQPTRCLKPSALQPSSLAQCYTFTQKLTQITLQLSQATLSPLTFHTLLSICCSLNKVKGQKKWHHLHHLLWRNKRHAILSLKEKTISFVRHGPSCNTGTHAKARYLNTEGRAGQQLQQPLMFPKSAEYDFAKKKHHQLLEVHSTWRQRMSPVLKMYLNKTLILAFAFPIGTRTRSPLLRLSEHRLQVPLGGSELLKCLNF